MLAETGISLLQTLFYRFAFMCCHLVFFFKFLLAFVSVNSFFVVIFCIHIEFLLPEVFLSSI